MFCKRTRRLVFATIPLLAIFIWDGCGQKQADGVERLAILPLENLTAEAQLNWASRAAAAAVAYDLAGSKNIFARQVDTPPDAQAMRASRVLAGYLLERNGKMEIHATLQDVARNKDVESIELDGPATEGVLPLANELARRLSGEARKFGTSNQSAFRFYGQALEASDAQSAQQALESATAADAGFAAAYIDEVKLQAERGDREGAERAAEAGRHARLDEIDRANLAYAAARVSGNASDRIKALESLAETTPADANVFRELGELRYARREFPRATVEYRVAAHLDPDAPETWNELAYALAFGKDLKGARAALAQYQSLAPGDINVLDSEGEVSYMLGDFKAASDYFEKAAAKSPAEWAKAAQARLMMGDLHSADAMFAKHPGMRAGLQLQMAQWKYLTGRREAGVVDMEKLAPNVNGDLQALAYGQLAMWRLAAGDRKAAGELAKQGMGHAQSAPARGICGAVEFLAGGGEKSSGSKMLDGYALMLSKKYRQAVPLLQAAYDETHPSNDWEVRALLAWAYEETGAKNRAAEVVNPYPLPLSSGDSLFVSVIFPQYLAVRSAVLPH